MRELIEYEEDPASEGGLVRTRKPHRRFLDIYGEMRVRAEGEKLARLTLVPEELHLNGLDNVHGGFLMAVVDHALFMGPLALGIERMVGGVTIEASTQFLAPVKAGIPIEVSIEVLRETGRMVFVRGLIEQGGHIAASYSGTIKKGPAVK